MLGEVLHVHNWQSDISDFVDQNVSNMSRQQLPSVVGKGVSCMTSLSYTTPPTFNDSSYYRPRKPE